MPTIIQVADTSRTKTEKIALDPAVILCISWQVWWCSWTRAPTKIDAMDASKKHGVGWFAACLAGQLRMVDHG